MLEWHAKLAFCRDSSAGKIITFTGNFAEEMANSVKWQTFRSRCETNEIALPCAAVVNSSLSATRMTHFSASIHFVLYGLQFESEMTKNKRLWWLKIARVDQNESYFDWKYSSWLRRLKMWVSSQNYFVSSLFSTLCWLADVRRPNFQPLLLQSIGLGVQGSYIKAQTTRHNMRNSHAYLIR